MISLLSGYDCSNLLIWSWPNMMFNNCTKQVHTYSNSKVNYQKERPMKRKEKNDRERLKNQGVKNSSENIFQADTRKHA